MKEGRQELCYTFHRCGVWTPPRAALLQCVGNDGEYGLEIELSYVSILFFSQTIGNTWSRADESKATYKHGCVQRQSPKKRLGVRDVHMLMR